MNSRVRVDDGGTRPFHRVAGVVVVVVVVVVVIVVPSGCDLLIMSEFVVCASASAMNGEARLVIG